MVYSRRRGTRRGGLRPTSLSCRSLTNNSSALSRFGNHESTLTGPLTARMAWLRPLPPRLCRTNQNRAAWWKFCASSPIRRCRRRGHWRRKHCITKNARAASNETAWATRGQLHLNLLAGDESPDLGNMAVKERSPGTADYKASAGRNPSGALFSRMN
jgi:hypothetical protein